MPQYWHERSRIRTNRQGSHKEASKAIFDADTLTTKQADADDQFGFVIGIGLLF